MIIFLAPHDLNLMQVNSLELRTLNDKGNFADIYIQSLFSQ